MFDRKHEPAATPRCLALLLAAAAACSSAGGPPAPGVPAPRVAAVVERDARLSPAGQAPDSLVSWLAGSRVILLGEVHYVEEHQQLVADLLGRLHAAGLRHLAQETSGAVAWTGEEYVMLRGTSLPRELEMFDRALLEALRIFNRGLPEADRIHYAGFDMNHWPGMFQTGLAELQARFGVVPALAGVMAARPDTPAYAAALADLPGQLAADRASIEAALGPERYRLLSDLVALESRSLPLRTSFSNVAREAIIVDRVAEVLRLAGGAVVAVGCGMNHAQRTTLSGPTPVVLGTWLAAHPELYGGSANGLRAVAFAGARGQRISRFDDAVPWSFDLVREDPPNSLTRILAEKAEASLAWLPLVDPLWTTSDVLVDYGRDVHVLPVGEQFDALVLYPSVTVLRSLMAP